MARAEVKVTIADLPEVKALIERLKSTLHDIVDPDDCWLDHHGYCQAHGWMETDLSCPHARAKQLLAALDGTEADHG